MSFYALGAGLANPSRFLNEPVSDCDWCCQPMPSGEHIECERKTRERTCHACQIVFVDEEPLTRCERCGSPIGVPA